MTNSLNIHALALKDATTLTLSGGIVTATQEYHVIAAQTGTADDLDTINLGYTNLSVKGNTYRPLLLLVADSGDTITLKHGTGNLALPGDADITLSDDGFVWLLWRGTAWYAVLSVGSAGATTADNVTMDVLGSPTYTTVQDWADTTQSAGLLTGGAITDNGDGTVAVAAGTGIIKTTDSEVGANLFFDWSQDTSVSLTDESSNWVYIDYNAGTPLIDAVVDWLTLDLHTQIIAGMVYREGTELHIIPVQQIVADFARHATQRVWERDGVIRTSGLSLSETGTRNIAISAGVLYAAYSRLVINAFDSSGAGRFTFYYRDGLGGWTEVDSQAQIDNGYWDDGTGVLNTLTAQRYANFWVYIAHDGDVYVQYGQGDYILAQAEAALVPTPPPELAAIATLCGKIIIQQGASAFTLIESAFRQTFEGTTVSDHGALAGLADDDHAQYALLAGRSGGQTLKGGTDSGDDLHLQTTSNATKGTYFLDELTTNGPVVTTGGTGALAVAYGSSDEFTANEASDYTTTSASFAIINSPEWAISVTTTGGDVLLGFSGTVGASANMRVYFDIYDATVGAYLGGDDGLVMAFVGSTLDVNLSFTRLVIAPNVNVRSYELHWKRVGTGTATLFAGAGTSTKDVHPQFWVKEVR